MTFVEELEQKNKIYDHMEGFSWRQVVYQPVHNGWEFANIGGHTILDFIGNLANQKQVFDAIEFCCGSGATCRYLSSHYDLRLSGVDINQKQIEFANTLLKSSNSETGDDITFVNADILKWQTDHKFDLAFVMDSLMLLPDIPQALRKMRAVLKDGGYAVIAEVAAGPAITKADRHLIWEFDGIVKLLSSDEYAELLNEVGFNHIEFTDLTELGIKCFQTMDDALRKYASEITEIEGEESLRDWQENTSFYLNGFKSDIFRYLKFVARNPAEIKDP